MKQIIFLTILLLSLNAYAEKITGETCGDDCEWSLENGVLTIKGSGRINDYSRNCTCHDYECCSTNAPWFQHQENITKVVIQNKSDTEKFTSIGSHAFEDMHSTREVVLPNGLVSIENEAFHANLALEKINLPDTLQEIGNWGLSSTNLSSIDIPSSVSSIGYAAFTSSALQTLIIPDNVSLSSRICDSCGSLTTVELGENALIVNEGGGYAPFNDTPLLQNFYCSEKDKEACKEMLVRSNKSEDLLKIYSKKGNRYIYDGKMYSSLSDISRGNIFIPKRIYTVQEANSASGKKNSVMIRYK